MKLYNECNFSKKKQPGVKACLAQSRYSNQLYKGACIECLNQGQTYEEEQRDIGIFKRVMDNFIK